MTNLIPRHEMKGAFTFLEQFKHHDALNRDILFGIINIEDLSDMNKVTSLTSEIEKFYKDHSADNYYMVYNFVECSHKKPSLIELGKHIRSWTGATDLLAKHHLQGSFLLLNDSNKVVVFVIRNLLSMLRKFSNICPAYVIHDMEEMKKIIYDKARK